MKKILLTLACIALVTQLQAQNFEFSAGANAGLFHYAGKGATGTSSISGGTSTLPNHTDNPYGSENGFSYGAYAQLQYVAKCGFIIGTQAGYDVLRSKENINDIIPFQYYFGSVPRPNNDDYIIYTSPNATGHTYLQDELINLNPYIGYRIRAGKVNVDLMPGIEFGFDINSYDKGEASYTNSSTEAPGTYTTDYNLGKAKRDIRAKFAAAASYHKWTLTLSYARGYTGYLPNEDSPTSGDYVHTRLLRMGIGYRIK